MSISSLSRALVLANRLTATATRYNTPSLINMADQHQKRRLASDGRAPRGGRGGFNKRGRGGGGAHFSTARPQKQQQQQQQQMMDDTPSSSTGTTPPPTVLSHLSNTTFQSLKGKVDDRVLGAIKFPKMTTVQEATLTQALAGTDVLAQAKTGTGKTVAFLLPAIQRLLSLSPAPYKGQISVLILSPTRELALQIEAEANILLSGLGGQLGVQHVVGGTNMATETKRLKSQRCDILVATPGRLLDHIGSSGLGLKLSDLKILVLDEADRMLDMGFRRDIEQIKASLPDRSKKPYQSLLFSATYTDPILKVADVRPDNNVLINTIPESEQNTHQHVRQESQVASMHDLLPLTLIHILKERQLNPGAAKVIVFFPTARATGLAYNVLTALSAQTNIGPVWEIHSRKSQSSRVKSADQFRAAKEGVLLSSDVAARGVDFPNVTLVIQTGLPASAEQYIHRLGRTARAGKEGRGLILLADWESFFLQDREMKALPLGPLENEAVINADLPQGRALVDEAMAKVDVESKGQAYQAALGYYKDTVRKAMKWDNVKIVALMNQYAKEVLLYRDPVTGGTTPGLQAKVVGKMGLRGTPGLNVEKGPSGAPGGTSGGPNGGRGGSAQRGRGGAGRGGFR